MIAPTSRRLLAALLGVSLPLAADALEAVDGAEAQPSAKGERDTVIMPVYGMPAEFNRPEPPPRRPAPPEAEDEDEADGEAEEGDDDSGEGDAAAGDDAADSATRTDGPDPILAPAYGLPAPQTPQVTVPPAVEERESMAVPVYGMPAETRRERRQRRRAARRAGSSQLEVPDDVRSG
jgi:hypothetical protein